jgi:iron-sulfur cluster assembly protein
MPNARARMQVMTLTDAAATRVREIVANASEPAAAIRVGVTKGGCAGMSYKIEYANEAKPGDEIVEDKGARVFVDPGAVLFLLGTQMDYKVDTMSAQFVFNNPNQTSACGCGESVSITPAAGKETASA